ncbi:proteasome ATPase, partial [Micrococcus luteus]
MAMLRRKLSESPRQLSVLEEPRAEIQAELSAVTGQNDRLVATLREARDQIVTLKEEVDRLAQPPSGYGIFVSSYEDGTVDVFTQGRKLRVTVSPSVNISDLLPGQEVMLNEALNVVETRAFERQGEIVLLKEVLEGGDRALVLGHTDEERVVMLAQPLLDGPIRSGDSLLIESRSGYAFERIPKSEVEELVLEEVPDIGYEQIGGLKSQIES